MSDTITLTLRAPLTEAIAVDGFAADRFGVVSGSELLALPAWAGSRRATLGDFFTVTGEKSTTVTVTGDLTRVDGIGAGMTGGTLKIEGSAGRDVGAGMTGGVIAVKGSVGDGAGAAMAGGQLRVSGAAGDRLGAALPGASRGMTGGEIVVGGDVGRDAGHRARRGLIVIGGNVGPGAARAMIAGTVVVRGAAGPGAGAWSKRGSVIALGNITVPETYAHACTYRPTVVRVLMRYLRRQYAFPVDDRFVNGLYSRYVGDLADVGKGEILQWQTP
jgi:formylmethanofuran dehydrogenase subunit C